MNKITEMLRDLESEIDELEDLRKEIVKLFKSVEQRIDYLTEEYKNLEEER